MYANFAGLTETFGSVVLEAVASDFAVAAERAGEVEDLIRPGGTGIPLDVNDSTAKFAEGLIRLVDASTRRHTADAARAYALTQTRDADMGGPRERYLAVV